jgi:O-antigen/teichoic acid export membrane protein
MLFSWIDKFAISLLLSTQLSAIYFNGSMNIPFLPLILSAVSSAILMQMASNKKENETVHTLQLINQSAKILSAIIFPLFFFFVFYRYQLFTVLLSDKYLPSVPIFLISSLAIPVRAYGFTTVLQNKHKGSIINAGAVMDLLLACILMYPLYELMGLPGVALSFVITTYLQAGFYLYHTARILKVSVLQLIPFANWGIKLIIFAFLFIIVHYISIQYFSNLFTLILGCAFSIVVVLTSLLIEFKSSGKHG